MSLAGHTAGGQPERTWGSTYPVSYGYDEYGRMTSMSTYRGGSGWDGAAWPTGTTGQADTTSWLYDEATGLLTNKLYADGKGTRYTYGEGRRLATRTWARSVGGSPITTTYSYDAVGNLTAVDYSDGTPSASFAYDRLGRQVSISDGTGSRNFAYDSYLRLTNEIQVLSLDAFAETNVLARTYDPLGRPSGLSLGAPGQPPSYAVSYGYDSVGRFSSVAWTNAGQPQGTASYAYLADSDLIETLSMGGFTATRAYEAHRDLLTQVKNAAGAATVSQYDYVNDAGGRRTAVKTSGSAFEAAGAMFTLYGYNSKSELTAAERYFGTDLQDQDEPVLGQQYAYGYDSIGNRRWADEGELFRRSTYTNNALNQYLSRTVPDAVDLLGTAATNATVTVNEQATTRQGAYWHQAFEVDNAGSAAYSQAVVRAVVNPPGTNEPDLVMAETGRVFVAGDPEAFAYDEDGNLTSDGRWTYAWDGENRLAGMQTATNLPASVPRLKLEFAYDYMGRRTSKVVSQWDGQAWQPTATNVFVYDGWLLVLDLQSTASSLQSNVYVWGLDLSGTQQGAGGIGGLLAQTRHSALGAQSLSYAYDANGNVGQLLVASNGALAARYEYDPYGNPVVACEGATLAASGGTPFRFSTKYRDLETGLYYYGFRLYRPATGRWLSPDPLTDQATFAAVTAGMRGARKLRYAQAGLMPVYQFVANDPIDGYDYIGLMSVGQVACLACACGDLLPALALVVLEARNEATSRFPGDGLYHESNAYRHCLGACRAIRQVGPRCALGAEWCHEKFGKDPRPGDREADYRNNWVGTRLAFRLGTCGDLCITAMRDKQLDCRIRDCLTDEARW